MLRWLGLSALIGVQIAYPLVTGGTRAAVVIVTVLLGFALSVSHAFATRGPRVGLGLVAVTAAGGLAIEAIGVSTGFPFGSYVYGSALGPKLFGVPLVVPLAWTWMAWPAWLVAGRLTGCRLARRLTRAGATAADETAADETAAGETTAGAIAADRRTGWLRIGVAGLALAGWDLFLDPQMVAQGYWTWYGNGSPPLPGEFDIPIANYLGWLGVALVMMAVFVAVAGPRVASTGPDAVMLAMYLWVYYSSVLAHALFLGLPASAWWGGAVMGLVAIPLTALLIAPLWMAPFGPAPARR